MGDDSKSPSSAPVVGLEVDPASRELGRGGFLRLTSHRVRHIMADGGPAPWYQVETAWPPFADAVVLLLYAAPPDEAARVLLRRSMRPATFLRNLSELQNGLDGADQTGLLWELPAGGIEPGDLAPGGQGPAGRASAEALEEAGHKVPPSSWRPLGRAPFSLPAFCPERLHYFAAPVAPAQGTTPRGDGHPMEEGAQIRWLELQEALQWCRQGRILDSKTEVGLGRLRDYLLGRLTVPGAPQGE